MKKSWLLFIIFLLLFFSCKTEEKSTEKAQGISKYKPPYAVKETDTYKVKTIIPEKYGGYDFQVDTVLKHIYITKDLKTKESNKYIKLKLDFKGNILDSFPDNKILQDKTILSIENESFSERLINNDTAFYKIYKKRANTKKSWLKQFNYFYNNSVYYYNYYGTSYFKTSMYSKNKNEFLWYYIRDSYDLINKKFNKKYPDFYKGKSKIIQSENWLPYLFIKNRRKNNIKTNYKYEAELIDYEYSVWGITITLPNNEKIYFKWSGNMEKNTLNTVLYSVNISAKKEVLFITSNDNYGMYAIIPKK